MIWVLLGLLALSAANPAGPVWPNQWTATWIDENSTTVPNYSGGDATYNWNGGSNPALLWHRWDGWVDPYCYLSLPMPWDTQCSHIVVGGMRYLYYPILNQCCMCCDDSQGCGVPAPDFMQNSTYLGATSFQSTPQYSWMYAGQYNYLETQDATPTNRAWSQLFSATHNYKSITSFSTDIDPAQLILPSICSPINVCQFGPCLTRRTNNCGNLPITFY